MWEAQWSSAVQRIAQGTPALVVSSVKWLEDEMELIALQNPGSRRGNSNEKAAVNQIAALLAALGGRVEVSAMNTIAGVKATYLLAVAFLEIIRFSSNGGILNGGSSVGAGRSAFSCVFEYLKTPNLAAPVFQCLTALVHQAFGTAVSWLKLVEGYLLRATQRSDLFAHILIWHLQGEAPEESSKDGLNPKSIAFEELLPVVRQKIIDGFTPKALELFKNEFDFFDKVTSISGVLLPLPKDERRAGIRRELEKIQVDGEDLYLPTAPSKLVRGIRVDSGIPLQSAAKVPIMVTFDVVDRYGDRNEIIPQACIFKVGDDCRQDVLALQVIALLRDIFDAVGLSLYLYPYGVLPTGPGRGIIEVVPNSRRRSQMGETTDGGLYEIFQQEFGAVGTSSFEAARENFIISSAGYAVASLLLQPKDRHNGNLLFDNAGRLVHIDFGFILETSPGGNMRFESAHFKLSHEMTQLIDPSGVMKSDTWFQFVRYIISAPKLTND